MFIDVTKYGGVRIVRVAVAAIAYLDAVEGGAALHLIGGETLRINEDPGEIEARCVPTVEPAVIEHQENHRPASPIDPELEPRADQIAEGLGVISKEEAVRRDIERTVDLRDTDRYPAKRGGRRGSRQ